MDLYRVTSKEELPLLGPATTCYHSSCSTKRSPPRGLSMETNSNCGKDAIQIRVDPSENEVRQQESSLQPAENMQYSMDSVALSFPGGGIRCAALSHGILRHLLEQDVKVEAIASVSGGGYIAGSFIQNVHHLVTRNGLSYKEAVKTYFDSDKMSKNAGFMVNCQGNLFKAFGELVVLIGMLLCWGCLLLIDKIPLWFVIALVIDALFGSMVRQTGWNSIAPVLWFLLAGLGALWIMWGILSHFQKNDHATRISNAIQLIFVGNFLLLMLIVFSKLFVDFRHSNENAVLLIGLAVLVLLRPLFDSKSPAKRFLSYTLYSALIAKITAWRIYKGNQTLFFIGEYNETTWNVLIIISAITLLFPFQLFRTTFFHYYYRWRLQRAFFCDSGVMGFTECGGHQTRLSELTQVKELPNYIAVTVLNGWKKDATYEDAYFVTALESGGRMKVIGSDVETNVGHLKLSESMALSSAAVAYMMGAEDNARFRFWQVQLGVSMGNWVYTKPPGNSSIWLLIVGQIPVSFTLFLVVFAHLSACFLLIPFGVAFLLMLLSVLIPPHYIPKIYHLPFVLNVFEIFDINLIGGDPLPERVYLSDGAHGDNMALLPLLDKRQYKQIVICDATEDPHEQCNGLLKSMNLCREKLGCSFVPLVPNIDIEHDVNQFVHDKQSTCFRFKVNYNQSNRSSNTDSQGIVESSEIIYLKPRTAFVGLHSQDFDSNLHGCCCETCHTPPFKILDTCCGEFPQHSTINQFFTPKLFTQYSKLGYKIAQEAFPNQTN